MQYTFHEATVALDVDQKTLRKWIKTEGWELPQDDVDQRRRLLTEEQLHYLGQRYKRNMSVLESPAGMGATIEALKRQMADLRQTVSVLQARIADTSTDE